MDEAREADTDPGFLGGVVALRSPPHTSRRDLVFGKSLRDFMGRLGINNDGGVPPLRVRNQMGRLFGCAGSLHDQGDDKSVHLASFTADKAIFWWDDEPTQMDSLFPKKIRLSQPFFDPIVRQPAPIDLNCLHALRQSSLDLDPYLWRTDRTLSLTGPLALTWKQLYVQHGPFREKAGDNVTVRTFRQKCFGEFMNNKRAWPELNAATERGRLILHPTPARVPPGQMPNAYA